MKRQKCLHLRWTPPRFYDKGALQLLMSLNPVTKIYPNAIK